MACELAVGDSTDAQAGQTNPSNIDLSPVFSGWYVSGDGDAAADYAIQVSEDPTFASVTHWDSGWVAHGTASGARCDNIAYAGGDLEGDHTYYWRLRFKEDHGGYQSPWAAPNWYFTTGEVAIRFRRTLFQRVGARAQVH